MYVCSYPDIDRFSASVFHFASVLINVWRYGKIHEATTFHEWTRIRSVIPRLADRRFTVLLNKIAKFTAYFLRTCRTESRHCCRLSLSLGCILLSHPRADPSGTIITKPFKPLIIIYCPSDAFMTMSISTLPLIIQRWEKVFIGVFSPLYWNATRMKGREYVQFNPIGIDPGWYWAWDLKWS